MPAAETPQRPKHYSVSQYKQYTDCPHQYYLERRARVWQRPAAWFPHGTAVHAAAEAWEKSGRTMPLADVKDVFRDSYAAELDKYLEVAPNPEYWFKSGRYGGEDDIVRRYSIGLEQVEKYVAYYQGKGAGDVIWITPDGTPAIELRFDIDLDGVKVRGFIDQVVNGEARDLKTGQLPKDTFQLGVYGVALLVAYGLKSSKASYWLAKYARPVRTFDITDWTRERVTEAFHWLDANVKAERFDPKPSADQCRRCPVATACDFFMR